MASEPSRSPRPWLLCILAAGLCGVPAGQAIAYPSAIIACPTGEVQGAGAGDVFLYDAYYPEGFQVWGGMNLGLGGGFDYGDSGLRFEGWEVGADLIGSGGAPAEARIALSVKAQVLGETTAWPALGAGLMGLNPGRSEQSLNLLFLSATKTLAWDGRDLGRLSAGVGSTLWRGEGAGFIATSPFDTGSNGLVMAGYESPALGPWSLAIDHVGSVSDYGGTNVALHFETGSGTYLALGYAFGNDPFATSPPGPFASLSTPLMSGWGDR